LLENMQRCHSKIAIASYANMRAELVSAPEPATQAELLLAFTQCAGDVETGGLHL